jgi:pSer/pThr/pTyr-binding forkhead associated (FHA) protein
MPRIVFTLEDGVEIESELDADVITVGRHPDSIVVLPSGSVSSHHATIKRRGGDFYVQDLGTTNGTKLNGVDVEEAKLDDGDKITFGDVHGLVHLTEAAPPARMTMPSPDIIPPAAPPIPAMATSRRRLAAERRARILPQKESTGCASFLIFLVFLTISFLVGLHLRHYNETQRILFQDLLKKLSDRAVQQVEEAPSSSAPEPAPESEPKMGKGKRMKMPPLQAPPSGSQN